MICRSWKEKLRTCYYLFPNSTVTIERSYWVWQWYEWHNRTCHYLMVVQRNILLNGTTNQIWFALCICLFVNGNQEHQTPAFFLSFFLYLSMLRFFQIFALVRIKEKCKRISWRFGNAPIMKYFSSITKMLILRTSVDMSLMKYIACSMIILR